MKEYKGFIVSEDLKIYNSHTDREIKPYVGADGYVHVARGENGVKVRERLHIVIGRACVPNPHNYKYLNHIDSNKLNNRPENLEWCTNSHNVKHGWDSGNRTHKNRTRVRATLRGEIIGEYTSIRQLGQDLQLSRHKVARILKGQVKNNYIYNFNYV